jgi:hypothetical protein
MMIKTAKVTERRQLQFSSMQDILDDLEYLDSGDPPRTTGNWSSAQIVQHVAKLIDYSIDGFPVPKAALPVRIMGRMMRKAAITKPLRAGVKLPEKFSFMEPDREVAWDDAAEQLRQAIGRLESERMTQRSPVLGKLSHEQWEQMHCRHAEMHFSFMQPE